MFQALDPQSKFYIYGWEFFIYDWTAQDFADFCNAPDTPNNIVIVDVSGCDWGDGTVVTKANGFYGRPWGTGIFHSLTEYADLLHARVRLYLSRLQGYTHSQWANTLTAFVMYPEGHVSAVDPWLGYCFRRMAWNPQGLTVEAMANDYARLRFGQTAQTDMAESILELEDYNNDQRPSPNITSDGWSIFPVHRTILTYSPQPLLVVIPGRNPPSEQHWADSILNQSLVPYLGSLNAAMRSWEALKDDPLYQDTLFQLDRSLIADLLTRHIISLWRYYQCATTAFAIGDGTAAARHIRVFDDWYQNLETNFDQLEYLLSKDPDYSFDRFLSLAGVPGAYPGIRGVLTSRGFYELDGYFRNENYEAFHYIYRRETEGFLNILSQRLSARRTDQLYSSTTAEPDVLSLFNQIKTEAMNRTNWALPPTSGTKRDAVQQVSEHLLDYLGGFWALLSDIPPIWNGNPYPTVTEPIFSPDGGTYASTVNVTLSCATPGAKIYYTTNGNDPLRYDPYVTSGASIQVNPPVTLKARAYVNNRTPSLIKEASFITSTAPEAVSIFPSSGTIYQSLWSTYTSTYSDANGATDIAEVKLLLNTSSSFSGGACFVYSRNLGKLYMINNSGSYLPNTYGINPGTDYIIETENGYLDCKNTTVSVSGNNLTVVWKIKPKTPMLNTTPNLYLRADDSKALTSGWVAKGAVNVKFMGNITGRVVLEDYVGDIGKVSVSIELRKQSGGITTRTVNLAADGSFVLSNVVADTYDLAFKASHWLRKVASNVQVVDQDISGINVSLKNGDCTADNGVNIQDLNVIKQYYGINSPENPNADLSGDGRCNISDLNILKKNYGRTGDP
jgi:hypothetical protein